MKVKKFILAVVSVVFAYALLSCDVGLGSAVDTQAPTLNVTYPATLSTVRGQFVFGGTCADDQKVTSVTVRALNSELGKSYGPYAATIAEDAKSWTFSFNKKAECKDSYNGWEMPDGKYTLEAVARDASGKSSGTGAITIDIDNTEPIFILNSPGTTDIKNPTVSGSSFKITGTIADDHSIKYMRVNVYENEGGRKGKLRKSFIEENIETSGGTSVALFKKEHEVYTELYGDIKNASSIGTKTFFCEIELEDSAYEYNDFKNNASGKTGNVSKKVYLYDSVYQKFQSSSGYGLEAAKIKSIVNETLTSDVNGKEASVVRKEFLDSAAQSSLAFGLNPNANPKYVVQGFDVDSVSDIDKTGASSQSISVQVNAGLDGTNVLPKTMCVYVFGPFDSVTEDIVSSIYKDPADYAKNNAASVAVKEENSSYAGSSLATYTFNIKLPKAISPFKTYIVAASGTDADGNDFDNDGTVFAFRGAQTGAAPTLAINTPANSAMFNSSKDLLVAGTVSYEGGIDENNLSLDWEVTITDENDSNKVVKTYSGTRSGCTVNKDGSWSLSIPADDVPAYDADKKNGKVYTYSVKVTATGSNELKAVAERSFHVDSQPPVLSGPEVIKTVKNAEGSDCVNGKINISGGVDENYRKTFTLTVTDDSGSGVKKEFSYSAGQFNERIDTTEFADGANLIITLTAEDKAGNKSEPSVKTIKIDQSTDFPSITPSNYDAGINSADGVGVKGDVIKNLFGTVSNNKLSGTAFDDDGVKTVTVEYREVGTDAYTSKNVIENGTSTTAPFTFALPSKEAKYEVKITVTDTEGNANGTYAASPFYIGVSSGAPALKVDPQTSDYTRKGEVLSVKPTVTSNVATTLTASYTVKRETVTETTTETVTVATGTITPDDKGNISLTVPATVKDKDVLAITYTATDIFGQSTSDVHTYTIDNTAPVLASAFYSSNDLKPTVNKKDPASSWYKDESLPFDIKYYDGGCGVERVEYTFTPQGGTAVTGSGIPKSVTVDGKKYYQYTAAISGFAVGTNTLVFTAVDAAGNKSTSTTLNVRRDNVAPTLRLVSIDGTTYDGNAKLVNGTKDVEFIVEAADAASGIASVKYGNVDGTPVKGQSGQYSFTIKSKSLATMDVNVTATDKARNTKETKLFNIILDNIAPVVNITSSLDKDTSTKDLVEVNGTIALEGNSSDGSYALTATPVFWYTLTKPTAPVTSTEGEGWRRIFDGTSDITESSTPTAWKSLDIDTKSAFGTLTDATHVYVVAAVTDSAQNTGYSSVLDLVVDQNTDRPQIKITSPKSLKDMGKAGTTIWQKNTKVIEGRISDDDGIKSLEYSFDNSTWEKVEPNGDSWEIEAKEGANKIYFRVTDTAGTTFTSSKTSGLTAPYITDGTNKFGTADAPDSVLYVTVDTIPPAISELKFDTTDTKGTYTGKLEDVSSLSNTIVGGTTKWLKIRAHATDDNGIKSVTVSIDNGAAVEAKKGSDKDGEYYELADIDLSGLDSGFIDAVVTATDNAGTTSSTTLKINVDNTAPELKVTYPGTDTASKVTRTVTMKGIASDNNAGIKSIEYKMGKSTSTKYEWAPIKGNQISWELPFESTATNNLENILTYITKDMVDAGISEEETPGSALYKVYVSFLVTDVVGNQAVVDGNYILVDAEGGKPIATVIYPETGATVGGSLTIIGTATDDRGVSEVQVQLDVNGDGIFDEDDYNIIKTWTASDGTTPSMPGLCETYSADWYITATGTNSWKLLVPTMKIAENTVLAEKGMSLRARAWDNDETPNTRGWGKTVNVKIDVESPQVENVALVQYKSGSSGETSVSRTYSSGMYITKPETGKEWYLTGTISSTSLSSITITSDTESVNKIFYEKTDPSVTDSKYTFSVRVPIIGDGKTSATINVSSESGLTTKYPVLFSVDSQAPQMYSTDDSLAADKTTSLRLTTSDGIVGPSKPVVNSNVVYTFGDVVKEEGSGLDYIAFYFKRSKSGGTEPRVYNPMFNTNGDNRTDIDTTKTAGTASGDTYINSDGLPVMYMKDAERSTETSFSHSSISGNKNIRVGGLIKIGGSYVRISAVNGDEVTFAPAKAESFTEAEFVYAQIVDHEITEGPTGNDYENVSNDDGDGMIETLKAEGSKYTWTACIFSDRIPDGPVEIHVVTIDKAGNINRGSIATSIQNKRPRIAKVLLGTDLDHNGTYDFYSDSEIKYEGNVTQATYNNRNFGEFNYYSAVDAYNKAQSSVTLSSETFKVKNGMCILPEFIGGNGTLKYNMIVGDRAAEEAQKGTSLTELTTDKTSLKVADRTGTKANIEKHVSSQGGIILTNKELEARESETPKYFAFTFWDETEETVQGTDSQWALLNIPVIVDVKDDTKPNASFNPFFWNGKGKGNNSLAYDKDGKALGHIELESDLTAALKVSPYGTGPKVSGKIVLRGTASDETLLTGLSVKAASVKAAETEIASAKYEKGVWSSANGLTVTNVREVDQNGHEVTWELEYETPSAQKDLELTVTATDGGTNDSAKATVNTAAEKRTALYTVDVVPYITNVKTMLSTVGGKEEAAWSTYGRTSTGAYVAGQSWAKNTGITGEKSGSAETVTLYGFNLAGGTVESSNGGSATLSTVSDTDNSFKFSVKDFKSGDYTVTVNGIPSINNKNSNDSKGSYTGSDAEQMYNRMPNGTTNNNLTDDFKMNIWDIRYDAATSQGGTLKEAVMRIAPGSDKIGFAFTNGASKFSMGGSKSGNSYQIWQSNYADFNNVSFVYDKNGNSYGTATGLDTYPDGSGDFAGRFTFMSSQWGICSATDMDDNYYGTNKLRMESIGIKGSKVQGSDQNTCIMDTYRFRSPTLATTMHGNSTSVYLAYYDTFQRQIRFRYGTFEKDAVGQSNNASSNNTGFYQFTDQERANNSSGKTAFDAGKNTYSLIAGKDADTLKDTGNVCIPSNSMASTCVAIDAIEGKTAEDDVVVAAWCTGSGVKFAYKKNPYTDNDADSDSANAGTAGYWSKAVEVFSGACEDVSIKADASGAVHISAYNKADQSLVYRHIGSDLKTRGSVVKVDSYQIVGSRTQIDVQKEGDYYVPYISYYNPATQKTKLAYLLAGKSGIDYSASGVKSDDTFTGNWEVSVIPTTSDIQEDHTNIGLWKDSSGARRTSVGGTVNNYGSIGDNEGQTSGNGTNNPVVGYATVIGIRGFIETAQMR